jgi:DNA-binding SARP family transcriptional activator
LAAVEVRLLGPLEVVREGAPLPLGGRKQRALLSLLALRANEVVPADRLIEALWGGRPPARARQSLYVQVSQLRKAVGDALETDADGYRLRAEVDAERFEELLSAGKPRDALALWRGEPLRDLDGHPEARRLGELRLIALEAAFESDLDRGRPVTADLEALVQAEPLRERPRALLMLALYRAGRQADALALYRETRELLVEELGIEPGPELQRLERAILAHDAALAAPPLPPAERAAALPPRAPRPAPEESPAAEERKTVTVLFCDVVSSTELGDQLDPESLRRVMGRYFEVARSVLERHEATVEKFIGDAVMAVFGIPSVHEDDPVRALRAAGELLDALELLNDELERGWGIRIQLRIGVSTGEVVTGDPRTGQALATGSAVHLAARLQQGAAPGEMLVSEATAAAARGFLEFSEQLTIAAKGKPDGIRCRRLVRGDRVQRSGRVRAVQTPFVGRSQELAIVADVYRRTVRERSPQVVTLVGDAGIGKTRLAEEFWLLAEREPSPPTRLRGRCLPYGAGVTYWPLREILEEHLGIGDDDREGEIRDRLASREILGLTFGLATGRDLHPLAARDLLHQAWVDLLDEVVAERPAVVVVEDLHWAEEPLLDLLEDLVAEVRGPLLLLATTRPELRERRWAWGGSRSDATTLDLRTLAPAEAGQLLGALLSPVLPVELRNRLVERAEGNPLFVEELAASLVDQGVLERVGERWVARELPADWTVPPSLHAVLAARIDLLPAPEKAAVQVAALMGRTFWSSPLYELLQGVEPNLRLLEDRGFVRRSGASALGGREFAFKHELIREVAYAGLPRSRRGPLHAAFADWLERAGDASEDLAPLLAHHFAQATPPEGAEASAEADRLRERARHWLRRAAELALGRHEIEAALTLLQQALEREPTRAEQAELQRLVGRSQALRYDGEGFWTAMLQAVTLCEDQRLSAEVYSELAFESSLRGAMWRRAPSHELVEGWLESALELAEPDSAALARGLVTRALRDDDAEAGNRALAIAERLGDPDLQSYALSGLAGIPFVQRRYLEAADWSRRRLAFAGSLSDPDHIANIHYCSALAELGAGRLDDARFHVKRHDEVATHLSPHHAMHTVGLELVVAEAAGEWDEIRRRTPEIERSVAANMDTPCDFNMRCLLVCALAYAQLGDDAEARRLERSAAELRMEGYDYVAEPLYARLALLRDDLPTVARLLPNAQSWLWSTDGHLAAAATLLDGLAALGDTARVEEEAATFLQPETYLEPFALRALGDVRDDGALVEQAAERFDALGLPWHAAETRAGAYARTQSAARSMP